MIESLQHQLVGAHVIVSQPGDYLLVEELLVVDEPQPHRVTLERSREVSMEVEVGLLEARRVQHLKRVAGGRGDVTEGVEVGVVEGDLTEGEAHLLLYLR